MSSFKVEIGLKKGFFDAIGESVKNDIIEDLKIKGIKKCSFVDVFYFNFNIKKEKLNDLIESIFLDKIINNYSVNSDLFNVFDFAVTVKYLKGMTDNVALTASQAIKDFGLKLKENESIETARKYYFKGKLKEKDIEFISLKLLTNPLIESFTIKRGKHK